MDADIFVPYVLNPRVDDEVLQKYRKAILEQLSEEEKNMLQKAATGKGVELFVVAADGTVLLGNPELRALWEEEVTDMRNRINGMRVLFVDTLKEIGVQQDFSFIKQQRGMFSFSGLSREQVATLRSKHAIYIVGSGRINVAGMTRENIRPLCLAIADVL